MAAIIGFNSNGHANVGAPLCATQAIPSDFACIVSALQSVLGPSHDPLSRFVSDPSALATADPMCAKQDWWAEQVQEARRLKLMESGTARDYVRMLSQEGPLARAWLTIVPSAQRRTTLSDIDFRSLCRYYLGLPLLQDGTTLGPCPLCREPLDPFGDHFDVCKEWCKPPPQQSARQLG